MQCSVEHPEATAVGAIVASTVEPVLVDVWEYGCPPCDRIAPVLDQIAGDYCGRLRVVKVNATDNADFAAEHGVMAVPTLLLFHRGVEIDRHRGYISKSDLARWLDGALRDTAR